MCDEADEMGLDRLRPQDMRLEVRADASAAGAGWIRPPAGAAVNGNRPSRLLRGRIDGMEDGVAEPSVERVVDEHHLDHAWVRRVAPDLIGSDLRQLAANHDGREESRILAQPALDAPVVGRARELGAEIRAVMTRQVAVIARGQDGATDLRCSEELIAPGRPVSARL